MSESKRGVWFTAPTHDTIRKLLLGSAAAMKLWFTLSLRMKWRDHERGLWRAGESWPSWRTIRKESSLSNYSISTGIQELVRAQLLEVQVPARGSTHYTLKGFALFGQDVDDPARPADCSGNQSTGEGLPLWKSERARSGNQSASALKTRAELPERELSEKNEGADASAPRPASEGDLVEITRRNSLWSASDGQRTEVVRSLVELVGFPKAALIVLEARGGDVKRLLARANDPEAVPGLRDRRATPCLNPECILGRVVEQYRTASEETVWKACPTCGGTGRRPGGEG